MDRGEFHLIERYGRGVGTPREDVVLGVGDDGAVVRVEFGHVVASASATETADWDDRSERAAASLAHRALARALAGVTARGGIPAWCTVALTLPETDIGWLAGMRSGLDGLARAHRVAVVGGDTTRGTVSLTLCCHGPVAADGPVRDRPALGDLVYVAGSLAGAAVGLLSRSGELRIPAPDRGLCEEALEFPTPPVGAAAALAGHASAAAVAWDGLESTLAHLLDGRGLGASLYPEMLPIATHATPYLDKAGGLGLALRGPGDLALAIIVPEAEQGPFEAALAAADVAFAWVGTVDATPGVRATDTEGMPI